jgi:Protein of unknown function (DUF2001).
MNNQVMNAKDTPSGSLAECYITIEGRRYNFMQLINFESKYTPTVVEVPILGQVNKGHKMVGGKGTWTATAHFNQSIMRKLAYTYQNTGKIPYFEIQVTNEDPTTAVGRQTIIHKDCLCEDFILAKFDADEDVLNEEISGTYESFEMPEEFKPLQGM